MKRSITLLLLALSLPSAAEGPAGLTTIPSAHDVATTADKLVTVLESKGITVFARIDHAAGAAGVGLELPPTELVIFGNPKLGTRLMQCADTAGIDLPLKALIWQDGEGKVWLGYNSMEYLDQRHGLGDCQPVLEKMSGVLANLTKAATD